MSERIVSAAGRGFLLLDSHPAGCFRTVDAMREHALQEHALRDEHALREHTTPKHVPQEHATLEQRSEPRVPERRPTALVIGSSAGYGLAATVAGLVRHGIEGVGIAFERPPARRTATAGWYRTIATSGFAPGFAFLNADAFADTTKDAALDLIAERFGGLDHLIYSVAAPRRTDPRGGITYQSVIKPLGAPHTTRTLEFDRDGTPGLREVTATPASGDEAAATVKVMGGEDWSWWIAALASRGLLREGFRTVALSYIGSPLTAAVYRDGTIGAAKKDLEATAATLTAQLAPVGGRAFTSVNGAAVTQASTAIPGIALYVSLLRGVLGERMQSPVEQSVRLWDQLTGAAPLDLDDAGRIRLDRWELDPAVQAEVAERWAAVTPATVGDLADIGWFRGQFRALYGFDVPGVDYDRPVETDLPWPRHG